MSHEILLIAGPDAHHARQRRRELLQHASDALPGYHARSVRESATAVAGLIETVPAGGSFGAVVADDAGERITVATNQRGLAVPEAVAATVGAEAGHVTVVLRPDGSVFVTTDGIGVLPAFWAIRDDTFVLSTHLASLVSLGLAAEVDERGLVEYLVMLHPMANRTLLRGASLLSAGTSLHWAAGRLDRTSAPLFMPSSERLTDDEAIGRFAEIWPRVVGDALSGPGRPSIGLSGGLDSRAISEAAVALGRRPVTYTYGTGETHEGAVSARVARVLALPHLSVPISDDRLLANAQSSLALLDGAHSASEMYELWFSDLLRSFTDVVINGLDGGTLWGDEKAIGLSDPQDVLARQLKRYSGEVRQITPFLAPQLRQEAAQIVRRTLTESLSEWDIGARADMVLFWRIANRQQRWGAMLTNALRRIGVRSEIPFLDSRFLALAARLTAEQRRNGNLYLRVHRELFPTTAGIPRSDDGNAPHALDHVYWSGDAPYVRQLAGLTARHPLSGARRGVHLGSRFALEKLRSRTALSGPADRFDARRSVFPADVWVRTRRPYADRLADLLTSGGSHPLISGDAVAHAIEGLRTGQPVTGALVLGRVAAVQAWLDDYRSREAARHAVIDGRDG